MSPAPLSMIESLATVSDAIGEALQAAAQALTSGGEDAAASAVRDWRSAHAALQLVNHRALVQFSTALGALIPASGETTGDTALEAFSAGATALTSYVNALVAGQRDQPMRLWPAYEAVQRARGVGQPLQSDLFFPDLSAQPAERKEAALDDPDALRNARRLLEGGLLQWLRKGDIAGLQQVAEAVTCVDASQHTSAARRLWWVAQAVLDAVLHDGLEADLLVRRLVTQLNLQVGRLVQGPADMPEALLREALYLVARARPVTPLVSAVQQAYDLSGALDAEVAAAVTFSAEAVAQARSRYEGLQELWAACATNAGSIAEFEQRARELATACEGLGEPALTALTAQLAESANSLAQSGAKLHDAAALEGACALLMIENALAAGNGLGAGFAARARNMAARFKVSVDAPQALRDLPPAQLLDDEARRALLAQHSALVLDEIGRALRDIELTLDGWFRDNRNPGAIAGLDKPFRQAAGALSVLGHAEAAVLAAQCRADVSRYAQGAACRETEQRELATRLATLAAFVEKAKSAPVQLASELPSALESPVQPPQQTALEAPLEAAAAPVEVAVEVAMEIPAEDVPTDGAGDTDPEMLEIFLEEAGEVLTTISDTTPQSRANPQDQELLTTLRRAFHTLKGSGRMVGLKNIGEAAWELEQVMNEMSPEQRPGTPDFYRLVDRAHTDFARWIGELHSQKQARVDASQLVDWARKLRAGEPLPLAVVAELTPEPVVEALADTISSAGNESVMVGEIRVSRALYDIMLPEARQNLSVLEQHNSRVQNGAKVEYDFLRAAHTLSGISGTAGFTVIRALGASLERVLQGALDHDSELQDDARALIARAVGALAEQIASIAVPQAPLAHADLAAALDGIHVAPTKIPHTSDAGVAAPAPALPEGATQDFMEDETEIASVASFDPAMLEAARRAAGMEPAATPPVALEPMSAPTDLEPVSAAVASEPLAAPVGMEPVAVPQVLQPVSAPAVSEPASAPGISEPAPLAAEHGRDAGDAPSSSSSSEVDEAGVERRSYRLRDDIDPQLLPIFLEEAAELVPQVGQDLRDWRARPDDKLVPQSLKRLLHTLKGSSRMAGAMALGQLTHSMESRVENAQLLPVIPDRLFDDLETSFDRIGLLIAGLQGTGSEAPVAPAAPLSDAMEQMARTMHMASATGELTQAIPAQPAVAAPGADGTAGQSAAGVQRPLIRVRADLIDRLANQAGEVSIARARVSAELRSARGSLRDLTENVGRLRAQLRELEIQAETQMQSRFSPQPEHTGGKFDPLEFDRFTRLQELTHMMAESVNDVATVQHNLARDLDEGEKALATQAQVTRDVQQDLMAIRMVLFSSISDRLFRVARLSAKDNAKRVELEISGGHVEIDRGVIERIAAPMEHLLRNAIVHGIEAPQQRLESGKPDAGALRIEVRPEGNEVVLTLTDDGAGLNLERIREKAVSLGLMRDSERLTDQQIANFIFRSGFSTAGEVTEDAGRGVGMDVVMSEITALGGRVGTNSQRGKGTTFTIHLPLTLSVLQAVVMRLGGNYYAVPTMMVEQVQRLKAEVLQAAHAERVIEWQGTRYPFHHLGVLLEAGIEAEEGGAPPYGSVVLLRSGANRAAIQVDDIVGGQEIVIKNIGAQLARVSGVTGAAVLGSGETVLILNPVLLSLRRIEQLAQVKEGAPLLPRAAPAAPVEPERPRSVLVVDDSLTVRKITGRLLTREGYIVLVAKDGVEALEKMRDQTPDVMITDVEMPRMDGFDLTRNVRADAGLKGLPIIMITSRTAEKHRQHATELGVDVFLGKPYEESELLGHIATLARRPVTA